MFPSQIPKSVFFFIIGVAVIQINDLFIPLLWGKLFYFL